jgi:hypothetical protein
MMDEAIEQLKLEINILKKQMSILEKYISKTLSYKESRCNKYEAPDSNCDICFNCGETICSETVCDCNNYS